METAGFIVVASAILGFGLVSRRGQTRLPMSGLLRRRYAGPVASGLLLAAAYYTPLLLPNFVAFLPLLRALDVAPGAGRWERMKHGFVFGLTAHLITLSFFLVLVRFTWLAVLLYVGVVLAFAAKIALAVALAGWWRRCTGLSWGVILPLAWIPVEWLQTFGDLRMTADHVAYSLARFPFLVQFADLVGPYGVGAVLLAANGLIHDALFSTDPPMRRRCVAALAVLGMLVLGYDAWSWQRPRPEGPTLRVALIQPDIPLLLKWDEQASAAQWSTLHAMSLEAAEQEPQLIVWPETARPDPLHHWLERPATFAMPEVEALARGLGTSLLVGVEYFRIRDRDDYDLYNAAMLVDATGTLSGSWAGKVYLVPFVEALPFRSLFGPLVEGRRGQWDFVTGSFAPGPRSAVIDVDGARVGVLVCFEQLFPDLARGLRAAGAELQVVITNDAWFGRTPFQRYQADALRLRAIETRSAFVRVANTGISGFVDRRGRFHDATRLFEPAIAVRDVVRSSERTVYLRLGDFVAWISAAGLVLVSLWAFAASRSLEPSPGGASR